MGGYLNHENQRYSQSVESQKAAVQTGMAALSARWGESTDTNTKQVVQFVANNFSEEARDAITKSGLANDPAMIESLFELSKNFQEDSSSAAGSQGFEFKDTKSAIDVLKSDRAKMGILQDPRHPDHKAVLKEWNDLHDKLSGKIV